jgi:AcrR family transcriptional regulator
MVTTDNERRSGAETRAEILRVAAELFTEKGFEGTSTRDISSALGITKSALYYHFKNKDEIVTSLLAERARELDELLEWVLAQPPSPTLVRLAALRWVEGTTPERLQLMRLAHANQPVMRRLSGGGQDVRSKFERVIDALVPASASAADRLFVRMAFDNASAALLAALGTQASSADVLATARRATLALTGT